jgi:hypothetical protein
MPWPLFTPRKDPVPIVQEAGWAPGPVWTGAENLVPHQDSIPRPSSLWPVTIPTTLPGPFIRRDCTKNYGCLLHFYSIINKKYEYILYRNVRILYINVYILHRNVHIPYRTV